MVQCRGVEMRDKASKVIRWKEGDKEGVMKKRGLQRATGSYTDMYRRAKERQAKGRDGIKGLENSSNERGGWVGRAPAKTRPGGRGFVAAAGAARFTAGASNNASARRPGRARIERRDSGRVCGRCANT